MKKLSFFAFFLILYSNFAGVQSAKLDTQEVKAVKEIWEKLGLAGKKELDFDKDPCSDEGNWKLHLVCNCSFESNTTCRVTEIHIPSQNVSTALPSEFTKLRYLQAMDLSRNYLSGTVPSEWATMRLISLSLMGNRLSGPFPTTLMRMTTLRVLSIEGNRFSGSLPIEIANMSNLRGFVTTISLERYQTSLAGGHKFSDCKNLVGEITQKGIYKVVLLRGHFLLASLS